MPSQSDIKHNHMHQEVRLLRRENTGALFSGGASTVLRHDKAVTHSPVVTMRTMEAMSPIRTSRTSRMRRTKKGTRKRTKTRTKTSTTTRTSTTTKLILTTLTTITTKMAAAKGTAAPRRPQQKAQMVISCNYACRAQESSKTHKT